MTSSIKNVLALYRIANLPHRRAVLGAFLASTFLLSFLELVGLASIGALLVQLFGDRQTVDFYIVEFESTTYASIFILTLWVMRAVLVVLLSRFNHAFIQRIKSGLQIRQCDVAFASKSRTDQMETGRLFTALTNEVQMLTGQVFIPLSIALAEAMLVALLACIALFIMPVGVSIAGGTVFGGYLLAHRVISPTTSRLGKKRLDAEKNWTEKVVNMFSLRREAEVYGVINTIKADLAKRISTSNMVTGQFYAIAPLNRVTIETIGILAILGFLLFAENSQAANETVMFILLAFARMLPSSTRILAAVQSYRFASPVIEKQLGYLSQNNVSCDLDRGSQIETHGEKLIYKFGPGVIPQRIEIPLKLKGLVVITGESGVGKTTMLDDFVDFLISKRSAGVNFASEICYASQNNLVIETSIHQNLRFYRDLSEENLSDGIGLLQDWGMPPDHFDMERRVTDFSGGQKKRVSVARALNAVDAIMVLDEPTSGLDRVIARAVIETIGEKSKDNLVVVATHDHSIIEFADVVVDLKKESKLG